jgi:hypothetical protein
VNKEQEAIRGAKADEREFSCWCKKCWKKSPTYKERIRTEKESEIIRIRACYCVDSFKERVEFT